MSVSEPSHDMNHLRAIFFDGDDTLWDFRDAMRAALGETLLVLRRIVDNEAADALTVERMVDIREAVAAEMSERTTPVETIRLVSLARALAEVGHPSEDEAQRLFEVYNAARFAATRPFTGVRDLLIDLRGRYQLGVVSNGNTNPDRVGLGGIFSFAVLAQDCGLTKPDPRIFDLALNKCGRSAAQVIHVGDSLESDVMGANGCGIRSVWLNMNGATNATGIAPDHEIGDLRELLDIL